MRPVQFDDMLKFRFLSRPAFSPDGTKAAYVVASANATTNGYDCDLWLYDFAEGKSSRLTQSHSERFFTWSRDGSEVIYVSSRAGAPKGQTHFYAQSLDGVARPLFSVPRPASSIADLGNGRYLLTATYEPSYPNPEGADYLVITQIPFTSNGKGFICQKRTAVAVYDTATGELTRLTPEHMDVGRVKVSADGTRALLIATDFTDVRPLTNHVYSLDLTTGTLECLSEGLTFQFHFADRVGSRVIVAGKPIDDKGTTGNSFFYELSGGKLTCLSAGFDSSLHCAVGSDCRYNAAEQNGDFAADGDRLIFCATDVYKSRLYALDPDGSVVPLTDAPDVVDNWTWKDGRALFVGFDGLDLHELYQWQDGTLTKLTAHNADSLSGLELSTPEYLSCESDGWRIDGWYMKPIGFEEGKKYPAILNIHGGPKSAFGPNYFHEMQCWAGLGYVVIFCNPRGGDGRGFEFHDIRCKYGKVDYVDIMAFTRACVEKLPFIDAANVGVTGGSYGGYMTNWIITQTDFFKAACAQRPISNWVSKLGCCDIGYYYVPDQHGGYPWIDPTVAWEESPLKHVANAKTPLLLIQSQEDFRCERDQSFQMFTALKVLGVECKMCLFNGENHELSRSGRPRNRLARLREITTWFDDHLKG